jgi:aryl-alcohol dehydrogenase-like predicted oxidoreductase
MGKFDTDRRTFMRTAITGSVGMTIAGNVLNAGNVRDGHTHRPATPEWRNRQAGMTYRMFGNTGMMVSEIVMGTTRWNNSEVFFPVMDAAFEKGINYIDTAPAYSKGEAEQLVGKYIKQTGRRDQIFLSSKISFYDEYMNSLIRDILKGLPQEKRNAIENRAEELIEQRGVMKPGYYFEFFRGQSKKFKPAFIRHLVLEEYGRMESRKAQIKKHMRKLVEDSMKATQVDHFDVLHCPHGVAIPEMLDDENIREMFEELKHKGIIRFSAVSAHNDVAGNLERAIDLGYYDGAMVAYNIANHAALETLLHRAKERGMGIVAMKVARIIHGPDIPQWRIDKLNAAVEETHSIYAKSYLWALQNPNISCCVSELTSTDIVADNTGITGKKIQFGQV